MWVRSWVSAMAQTLFRRVCPDVVVALPLLCLGPLLLGSPGSSRRFVALEANTVVCDWVIHSPDQRVRFTTSY